MMRLRFKDSTEANATSIVLTHIAELHRGDELVHPEQTEIEYTRDGQPRLAYMDKGDQVTIEQITAIKGGGWHVLESTISGFLLANDREDYRLWVSLDEDEIGDSINRVYPCRTCGWDKKCEEGCHS